MGTLKNQYYADGLVELYHADCEELLPSIRNEFALCITSPPYNIGNTHHTNKHRHTPYADNLPEPEYQAWQVRVLNLVWQALRPGGWLFYNHQNRIRNGRQISPYEWLPQSKFIIKQEVVWHRGSPNMDKCRFYPFTERIYCLAKDENATIFNSRNLTDDWHISPVGTSGSHARAFPEELVSNIIGSVPNASEGVFDPFCGSGTVLRVCKDMNIRAVGIEKEEKYCKVAVSRMAQEVLALNVPNCGSAPNNIQQAQV